MAEKFNLPEYNIWQQMLAVPTLSDLHKGNTSPLRQDYLDQIADTMLYKRLPATEVDPKDVMKAASSPTKITKTEAGPVYTPKTGMDHVGDLQAQIKALILSGIKRREKGIEDAEKQLANIGADKEPDWARTMAQLYDIWNKGKTNTAAAFPGPMSEKDKEALKATLRAKIIGAKEGITGDQIDLLKQEIAAQTGEGNPMELLVPEIGVALTKKDSQYLKKELPDQQAGLNAVARLREINEDPTAKLNFELKAEAQQLVAAIKGAFRIQITGGGNISEHEQKMLNDIARNPTKIFTLPSSNRAAYDALEKKMRQRLDMMFKYRLRNRFPGAEKLADYKKTSNVSPIARRLLDKYIEVKGGTDEDAIKYLKSKEKYKKYFK